LVAVGLIHDPWPAEGELLREPDQKEAVGAWHLRHTAQARQPHFLDREPVHRAPGIEPEHRVGVGREGREESQRHDLDLDPRKSIDQATLTEAQEGDWRAAAGEGQIGPGEPAELAELRPPVPIPVLPIRVVSRPTDRHAILEGSRSRRRVRDESKKSRSKDRPCRRHGSLVTSVVAAPYVPPVVPPPKPAEPDHPQLSLMGTAVGESEGVGVFLDQGTKNFVRLKTGQNHDGWILRPVREREATFEKNDLTATLSLPIPRAEQGS
jgi:hypothetical protein